MVDGWIEDGNERKASRNSNNELYSIIMFALFEPRSRDMRGKTEMLVLVVSQKVQVSKSIEVEKNGEKVLILWVEKEDRETFNILF